MKSKPCPTTHTATTTEELTIEFGSSGSRIKHTVTVPKGATCRKLPGGSSPTWVVYDLNFIEDKRSILYSDADIYGIRIPENKLENIQPLRS